jgi:hypothetical protein
MMREEFLGRYDGVELYKNPRSIKRMGKVRAVSDIYGDLYVTDAYSTLHGDIVNIVNNKTKAVSSYTQWASSYRDMRNYKYLFWEGSGNIFYFSDSQQDFYFKLAPIGTKEDLQKHNLHYNIQGLKKIDQLMLAVKKRNSHFEFYISEDFVDMA